ncbi:Cation transporter, partial [Dillenia turbinata]
KLHQLACRIWSKVQNCFQKPSIGSFISLLRDVAFSLNPFCVQVFYFMVVSFMGYLALIVSKPKNASARTEKLDLFFTSVSATTVSSMSTVEMEVFSNFQLIIITLLMLFGGEVFTSLLGLQFQRSKFTKRHSTHRKCVVDYPDTKTLDLVHQIDSTKKPQNHDLEHGAIDTISSSDKNIKYDSLKCLSYVVLAYLSIVHLFGSALLSLYLSIVPRARQVLESKGLQPLTFSVFTTVSTFTNCGFVPTNENMVVFLKDSGLLLLLIPQILLGNSLYPLCLRFFIWVLKKIRNQVEYGYILEKYEDLGYDHLMSGTNTAFLGVTVMGFIVAQLVVFCSVEWNSEVMEGLNWYEKLAASLFQVANSRHAGESVFDLSILAPSILVLFAFMMYLPPYTSFSPIKDDEKIPRAAEDGIVEKPKLMEHLLFSPLSYLAIFVILIGVTEREKMVEDPLNFNVLNIVIEVVSAYGNVGFSTGYSCKRRLKLDGECKDAWTGFAGRWSNKGKLILILVMFFGRLKKFTMK